MEGLTERRFVYLPMSPEAPCVRGLVTVSGRLRHLIILFHLQDASPLFGGRRRQGRVCSRHGTSVGRENLATSEEDVR